MRRRNQRTSTRSRGHSEHQDWAYIDDALRVPEGTPGIDKAWVLAEIPWRNIREIDPGGDGYYGGPHLFCAYADNGTPYERIVARVMGEHYDYPLDPAKQHADLKSLADLEPSGGGDG